MRVIRIDTTVNGDSRMTDVEIPLISTESGQDKSALNLSRSWPSLDVRIAELPAGHFESWHGAPIRCVLVILAGSVELVTTDLELRQFNAGDVLIMDDVTALHTTRVDESMPLHFLIVPLPTEFELLRPMSK